MRKGKPWWYAGLLGVVVAMVGFPIGITVRASNLEKLNRRLLSAVKSNDTTMAIKLLSLGADANTHDDPSRTVSP
ncbi:MAG: hypothetical protein JWN14_4764 [Chthonomonadales bacterium]|nr:hypothetical protein [Chthonomonadales bacterium]